MSAVPADDRPDWSSLKAKWPNAALSRFVEADGLLWHIQRSGPKGTQSVLLIHGTGASTHSFAESLPLLAKDHDVLAIDLPGHGFTATAPSSKLSLPGMSKALERLLESLEFKPHYCAGHSAGAAIALQMAADGAIAPDCIIGLNAALKPIEGNAVLAPLAKMLFVNPFTPRLFSMQARYTGIASTLLQSTNTPISEQMHDCYRTLMENPAHVNGALGMMANWNLKPLIAALGTVVCDTRLVVARNDKMVPPSVSREAAARMPNATVIAHDGGGHLMHEIDPEMIGSEIKAHNDDAQTDDEPVRLAG